MSFWGLKIYGFHELLCIQDLLTAGYPVGRKCTLVKKVQRIISGNIMRLKVDLIYSFIVLFLEISLFRKIKKKIIKQLLYKIGNLL